MNHERAVREQSVDKYLLGELAGDERDAFEEHLFDCAQCGADLRAGLLMSEGMRAELSAAVAHPASRRLAFFKGWLNPILLASALAACLALVVYQNAIQIPRMATQLAQANTPAVLDNLVLAGGAARGGDVPHITAPRNGSFLLSVDIPFVADATGFTCILYAPSGKAVWSAAVTPDRARDAVAIHVPAAISQAGENTLVIQAMRTGSSINKMEIIASRKFFLELRN